MEVHRFEIAAIPPYSFELTVHKPAGWWWSTPDEVFEDGTLWTAIRSRGRLLGLRMTSLGSVMRPRIGCTVFSSDDVDADERGEMAARVRRALRVDEDLGEFYGMARRDDLLRDVVQDLYGMRTQGWPELFPALILAVTLQMAPMKRSSQMMSLLIERFGVEVAFDGKTVRYWPSPERIAAEIDELRAKANLGYRAANLRAIAKSLVEGFPTMEELSGMLYEEAKKRLMSLRGIGDYSADLVAPERGFSIDVWSAKIFHVLFFGSVPENPREVIPRLKGIAEERWGRWRGHAFVYVLNDLPRISERIGIDVTRF